jgi:hypothetical protein
VVLGGGSGGRQNRNESGFALSGRVRPIESFAYLLETLTFTSRAPCIWLVSPIGEYALLTASPRYEDHWEATLNFFNCPRCDEWPRKGVRPGWWVDEWADAWPYERGIKEQYDEIVAQDPLALLAGTLSLQPDSSRPAWSRLGSKGDAQRPGRALPLDNLSQIADWVLAPDAGLRKTRREARNEDESEGAGPSKGKRRTKQQGPDRSQKLRRR